MRTIFLVALFACVAVAFAAPVQNPLGEDAEKLKKEAQDVIAKLKSEGKHVLAAEITVIEKEIEALEKKVKEINPTTEVGKIAQDAAKKVLAALETKLKAEIKKLGGAFFDTKQQLGDDAAKLKKEAQDVISKLKAEGKHVLAEEISIIEKEVELLETKIKSLNPSTEVGKIALHAAESVLKALETKLKAEIKKLSGAFFDTKQDLQKDADKLKKEAQDVISKLKAEGKHVLAAEISVIEKEVEELEKKVHNANPTTEVGKIALHAAESVLKALETKLKAEMKKLGGAFFDTKQDLQKDADKLKKEAQDVIAKLKSEGKHVLATEIAVIEKEVEELEKKVHNANPTTEVGKIALHAAESVLKGLETKLKAEIKKLGGAFFDTKQDLEKDADKLKKEAQDVISKLKAEGKHVLAEEISIIEKEVEVLEKKVKEINPTTEVGKIAQDAAKKVLAALETKLKAEIKKLGGAFFDTKQDLQKDADKLKKEAQDVISKLKAEGKHVLAAEISVIEKEVEELEKKVHNANPTTEVGKIALHAAESVLKGLETKLKAEIKKLGGAFFDTKQDLEKDAAKLRAEAKKEADKLKAEGKHVLAAEITVIEKAVEKLEAEVAHANPHTEVGKVALEAAKSVLKSLETKLKEKIAKLNNGGH